ncbi:MAG: tetratricopeptide repeat protein [Chlorobaculum sp.]|nr:tetratricopeptide repeat protein [Chlorobaculum sp.]
MTVKPDRIGAFVRLLLLLAALFSAGLLASPAKAAVSRDSTATSSAEDDLMPDYVQALLLDMKGDYWGAIDVFQKVKARRPANAAVKYSISKAYFRLAVLDSARVYGEAAVKLDPSNRHYLRYLAGLAHDMKAYDQAAELFGQAALLEPERTDILYLQGLEYLAAKRPEPALEAFEKASRIDPFNEAVLTQTLMLEIGLNRYLQAIETAKQLLDLGGNEEKLGITLADLYAKSGQEVLSMQMLGKLAEDNHGNITYRIALFDHYIKAGRIDDFHRELTAYLDKESPSKESLHDFAKLYISLSGKDSLFVAPALALLDELIARSPRDSELFMLKGMYFMVRGRQPEGIELLAKSVQLNAGNVTAWEYLITARFESGDKRKAFELLAQARRKLPGQRLRWSAIEGYLLLYSNAPKQAAAVLEKVVGAKQKHQDKTLLIQANNNLAMACDQLGKKKQCRDAYERVLELDPHNTLAMNNLAYMLAEEGIRLQHALRLASNAVMLDPNNGVYLDTLGWVHHKLGNNELARQLLEKAVATGLEEAEVYRHLAELYKKLGYEAKAKEMLERAKGVKK